MKSGLEVPQSLGKKQSKIRHQTLETLLHLLYLAHPEHQQFQCMNIENSHPLSTVHMQDIYPQ